MVAQSFRLYEKPTMKNFIHEEGVSLRNTKKK